MKRFLAMLLAYLQAAIVGGWIMALVGLLMKYDRFNEVVSGPGDFLMIGLVTCLWVAVFALPGFGVARALFWWFGLTSRLAYAIAGALAGCLPVLVILGIGPALVAAGTAGAAAALVYRSGERFWLRRLADGPLEAA